MYNAFLVWMARAKVYWNLVPDRGFCKEYNFIRYDLKLLLPYKKKVKNKHL